MGFGRFLMQGAALAAAALLSACGGGGGSSNDCSGGQNVFTNLSYPNAFDVYHAQVGVPITPLLAATDGIPAACLSSRRFSLSSGSLPPGLQLDNTSGTISGTPSTEGFSLWIVQVSLTGFTGSVSGGIFSRVANPASYDFSSWSTPSSSLPVSVARLDAIGNALVLTSPGSDGSLLAQTSGDEFTTATPVTAGIRPGNADGYATAHDGIAIYGAGGIDAASGTYRNDVWKFDGTQWSIQTPAAAFPARRDAAMIASGGALYVAGGSNASGLLNDVWRSNDDGQSWQQTSGGFAATAATALCAFSLNGSLAVVTTRPAGSFIGANAVTELWRSNDAVSWSAVPVAAGSPLQALNPAYPQCVVMAGRVYLFGSEDVVSSADLATWRFEPMFQFDSFPAGGGASIAGHLYIVDGLQTSQRSLHRSNP